MLVEVIFGFTLEYTYYLDLRILWETAVMPGISHRSTLNALADMFRAIAVLIGPSTGRSLHHVLLNIVMK
jgi:hypothetical protein